MTMFNKAKYFSLLVLLGAWGCTTTQNVSRSGGYDPLYGGNPGSGLVSRDRSADQEISRSDNPDYTYTGDEEATGTSDYYDDSYLSSRSVKRNVSNDVGYNAGFVDGYNQANSFANPYSYGGLGSYWPGSGMNFGLQFGLGSMFRMRPYMGFGMSPMMGYSPWGYGSMMGMGYGGMMGYGSMLGYGYDPFGYNSFGYSPWGYNSMYGYGMYDSYYGGYGYNPWAYSRPVVVVNNNYERQGLARTSGPRIASGNSSRNRDSYNSNFVNSSRSRSNSTPVTEGRAGRRAANAISANDTYSSPRSSRSYGRNSLSDANGRTSGTSSYSSRGENQGNNVYYSRPRSTNASSYSSDGVTSGSYASPRSSRGASSYSSPSYNSPSRSQSDYSAPARSYSTPSSRGSESYSAPSRSYSAPSYSAPSRSYSAPSGGGGGGGATRSSSRGPR
ncbi:hypothetical protein [Dyadobacter sediminis]|uniref:Prolyl-tRNA synthetase n=2 Tax=Dyadobacter sediminis TaxID=1493691 RepID=A0A5R9KFJ4_9BACT|nr:hypothetical protein [Dyadobacter sediminis]TLU94930.1 hypothetical protein FEM55_12020 [Dyadobacter sediminis]GGB86768.1 hypothetical protein GCM10011325_12880 [Dyadobacter sediminis]